MYDFQGIWYRIIACGCVFLILGIWILLGSHFGDSQRIEKKEFGTGCLSLGFSIIYIIGHLIILSHPEVLICTGIFIEEHRAPRTAPPLPLTWEYTFDTGEKKRYFDLDTISKKQIFPEEGLELGEKYQIYYEKYTKIIVRIDHLTK